MLGAGQFWYGALRVSLFEKQSKFKVEEIVSFGSKETNPTCLFSSLGNVESKLYEPLEELQKWKLKSSETRTEISTSGDGRLKDFRKGVFFVVGGNYRR